MNGYIKLHRKLLDNPVVCKDGDHLAVWVWLLLKAAWSESDITFGGKRITLQPGDLPPVSRKTIASELRMNESKVQRILKSFENEHQIKQRTNRQCRLISIVSWNEYQISEQPNEQRVNNERTTSEQRVNTIKEYKNNKKYKNDYHSRDIDNINSISNGDHRESYPQAGKEESEITYPRMRPRRPDEKSDYARVQEHAEQMRKIMRARGMKV